ncbi:protein ALTERED PHOSPHATE STARVATION RESPONSE 1-like [Aristolochia californica]|uniref:protein ALTERED PHOSPHATE STARVATION RESPONSE 1-like n=1 Tax=Aristolochia californica TaxID=171875 RepID=UPI0035DF18E9
MGNCTASRLSGDDDEDDVVSLCRDRKRLLKSAVDRRYALADAHCRYVHSLQSVAAALHLFVARHSAPAAPYLITLPSNPEPPPFPCFETSQTTTTTTAAANQEPPLPVVGPPSSPSSSSSSDTSESEPSKCAYSYSEVPVQQPENDVEWDFFSFNPFHGVRTEAMMMGGLGRTWDEDLKVVREEEGIPELEEEEERDRVEEDEGLQEEKEVVVGNAVGVVKATSKDCNMSGKEQKGLTVIDTPSRERELLDALRDVEDHFIRAYDSGKEVSIMLEANRVHLQSGLEEIKENSSKLIQAITWHRASSQSSSHKSSVSTTLKNNGTWTEYKNDLFDDQGGMESGSHSLTLGRLYAWEKKLYNEVKGGDRTRRIYERRCSQLRNLDVRGDESRTVDKTRNAVKDLYTRIWVALRTAESISNKIQKLRDEELQPQLLELLEGLMKTWKVMLESHETQKHIMTEVTSFTSSTYGRFCGDPHQHATLQLETEIQNWRACFTAYIGAQMAYVKALSGWLSKFLVPEVEFYSRDKSSLHPYSVGVPPLVIICHDWLNALEKLPDTSVAYAMKSFTRDVRALWVQQGEEQQQKRKVDNLAKELDRRVLAFQRTEKRILESKISENSEPNVRQQVEYLSGRKDLLDTYRNRLDLEKAKHRDCMQETQRIIVNGFQTGFTSIFESLSEFSKASLNMYNELVLYGEKTRATDEKQSCIEGSQKHVD